MPVTKSYLSCFYFFVIHHCKNSLSHRRRGSPGTCPPIIENRPCIYHFLPPLAPSNILVCPPNIFVKSTPVTFHHCTLSFITAHFVHHCTLKQALTNTVWPTNPLVITIIVPIVIPLVNSRACFKKNSRLHISSERFPSLTQTPKKCFISSLKILMTFFSHRPQIVVFSIFFTTFHNKTPYFSLNFSFSSLKNSNDLF